MGQKQDSSHKEAAMLHFWLKIASVVSLAVHTLLHGFHAVFPHKTVRYKIYRPRLRLFPLLRALFTKRSHP